MGDGVSILTLLVLFGTVAFGAVIPIVPTGAAVSAAAVLIHADKAWELIPVILVGAAGAYLGDIVTYGALRVAGVSLARRLGWLREGDPGRTLARIRTSIERHELRTLLLSRLVPGGRVPVLLAASLGGYPWRRFAAAAPVAATIWALAYALVGVGGDAIFTSTRDALIAAVVGALALTTIVQLIRRRSPDRT